MAAAISELCEGHIDGIKVVYLGIGCEVSREESVDQQLPPYLLPYAQTSCERNYYSAKVQHLTISQQLQEL